ncbi:MAG: hypothetical protein AAF288_10485 [Planctomycetota bacterium]
MLLWLGLSVSAGCVTTSMQTPTVELHHGAYERVYDRVGDEVSDDRGSRRYVLDRLRTGVAALDAGRVGAAEGYFDQVYDLLRTQGLNADRTVASVVLTEGVKIWKGEPFEQALGIAYFGITRGVQGSWDNVRAASAASLFYLRDFAGKSSASSDAPRPGADGYWTIQDASLGLTSAAQDADGGLDEVMAGGYVAERSDFTLGYLLHGAASLQLGERAEGRAYLAAATAVDPRLRSVARTIERGQYNALLVVGYGIGPVKQAYGPAESLTRFAPMTPSGDQMLVVEVDGREVGRYPVVLDVNRMASDHRWNSLEDVRQAKAVLGEVALYTGLVAGAIAIENRDENAAIVAGAALLTSAIMTASARADVAYCDLFPQRFYVAPITVPYPGANVWVRLSGLPRAYREVGVVPNPPPGYGASLVYTRVPTFGDLAPKKTPAP